VRARHLISRCAGRDQARSLAGLGSLDEALSVLSGTAYGRLLRPAMGLAEAQRAVAATALWHARVLAGWLPSAALRAVRALAGWFELANIEERVRYLGGHDVPAPFELGALGTVWPLVAEAQSADEVRGHLAGSPWGDPATAEVAELSLALRFAWARRVLAAVDDAGPWAVGAVALLVARELLVAGRPGQVIADRRPPGIGTAWVTAGSLGALRDALPPRARWALEGLDEPRELWRAEAAWWRRVEEDGGRLLRDPHMGRATVVGCLALLGADARRVAGALESAARGSRPQMLHAYDDVG
jgi:hypothetical protein